MNGLQPLIPVTLFFSVASLFILKGALIGELEEVRYRLSEVEGRIDFHRAR